MDVRDPTVPNDRPAPPVARRELHLTVSSLSLAAALAVPEQPRGLVVFAHGTGSGRHSPRNQAVARRLEGDRLATLLLDLLEPNEEGDRRLVFDVVALAERLAGATDRAIEEAGLGGLPLGYFGASTGAAAALIAAARRGEAVGAVVSRGGRPDLAGPWLPAVGAPTLLIVGGADRTVLELNEAALADLRCVKALEVIPGATHLFEEPGALERVTELAASWFSAHLPLPAAA